MKKKIPYKPLLVLLVIAEVLTLAAYATVSLWSNEVIVNVGAYSLVLNDPADGTTLDEFVFSGALTLDSAGVSGKTVTLHVDDGSGYTSTGLTDVTASDGSFSITWSTSTAGTYSFKVMAEV